MGVRVRVGLELGGGRSMGMAMDRGTEMGQG